MAGCKHRKSSRTESGGKILLNQQADAHLNLDWLIIGGGIHGVHMAARLIGDVGVAPDQIRIVDPGVRLLARWRTLTETTGMRHLRSPAVHHLDLAPWSLRRFAKKSGNRKRGTFTPPFDRPNLELFNRHCDLVIQTFGLEELHVRSLARTCSIDSDCLNVELSCGQRITTQNVVLAIGASDQPRYPDWAPKTDPRINHVFDPAFDGWLTEPQTVALFGGGISAAQIAIRLTKEGHRVHLVSRHPLRKHQFDSEPGWLGPKFMKGFGRVTDYDRRRAIIAEARHTGSVPPDVFRALRRAIACDQLDWHEAEVEHFDAQSDGITLRLNTGECFEPQQVLLATGFTSCRPGGALVDEMISAASLPIATCGYPIIDSALRWHPRVYLSGPLAELELGPVSRNIAGARRAGDRIVDALLSSQNSLQQKAS